MLETMRIVSQTQRQAVSVRFYPLHCEYRSNSANKQEIKTSVETPNHLKIKSRLFSKKYYDLIGSRHIQLSK